MKEHAPHERERPSTVQHLIMENSWSFLSLLAEVVGELLKLLHVVLVDGRFRSRQRVQHVTLWSEKA